MGCSLSLVCFALSFSGCAGSAASKGKWDLRPVPLGQWHNLAPSVQCLPLQQARWLVHPDRLMNRPITSASFFSLMEKKPTSLVCKSLTGEAPRPWQTFPDLRYEVLLLRRLALRRQSPHSFTPAAAAMVCPCLVTQSPRARAAALNRKHSLRCLWPPLATGRSPRTCCRGRNPATALPPYPWRSRLSNYRRSPPLSLPRPSPRRQRCRWRLVTRRFPCPSLLTAGAITIGRLPARRRPNRVLLLRKGKPEWKENRKRACVPLLPQHRTTPNKKQGILVTRRATSRCLRWPWPSSGPPHTRRGSPLPPQ